MPPELHRAVERCYRADRFTSERERVEHLFRLYGQVSVLTIDTFGGWS